MNEPDAASEQIAETVKGVEPDPSLNPHLGHLVPDEAPDGDQEAEPKQEQKGEESESPSDGEDNAVTEPDDTKPEENLQRKVGELAYENRQLKRQLEERQKQPEVEEPAEPLKTLKDFDYDESAFNGYLVAEAKEQAKREFRAESRESTVESEVEVQQREFQIRQDAFEADNPGFKERLHAEDLAITPEMAQFIADPASEVGLHVGDYLARNKTKAAKIAGMKPVEQFRAMTKLEDRIGKEVAKANAERKKASKAPEPPSKTVDGSNPGLSSDPSKPADADKMSDEEWNRRRNKQLAERRAKR